MNGLRVYVQAVITAGQGSKFFYSRRGNGPYYRWAYNEQLSMWRSSRMKTSDVTAQLFSTASWKSVPVALQTRLGEHYIE